MQNESRLKEIAREYGQESVGNPLGAAERPHAARSREVLQREGI
jgi:hypothetical protein